MSSPPLALVAPAPPPPAVVPQLFSGYLSGQMTEATRRAYRYDVEEFFGGAPTLEAVLEASPEAVVAWRNAGIERGLSPVTVNRKLTALHTWFDYLEAAGIVSRNPVHPKLVRRLRVGGWDPQLGLSHDEFARLLAACREGDPERAARDEALVALAYQGLLRRSELAAARWGDLTRDGGFVLLRLPRTKGGANQRVPVEPAVLRLLDAYFRRLGPLRWVPHHGRDTATWPIFLALGPGYTGRALSGRGINRVVQGRARAAGLACAGRVHAHTLRHTGITHLIEATNDVPRVQALARHRSLDMTMRYHTKLKELQFGASRWLGRRLEELTTP